MAIPSHIIKLIPRIGAVFLAVGIFTIVWAFSSFDSLPNYLRLAAFLPFAFSVPLVSANDYFDGWAALPPREKGRAIAWLIIPFVVAAGAICWYVIDPAAKA